MSFAKVITNGTPQIDLTADTVTANTLAVSTVAVTKDGSLVSGTRTTKETERDLVTRELSGLYRNHGITAIGREAFYGCGNLTGVDLPNVTSIGIDAFRNCTSLVEVNVSKTPSASLNSGCFYGCSSLTTIKLGMAMSEYGGNEFRDCVNLKTVVILGSNVSPANDSFNNCTSLEALDIKQLRWLVRTPFPNCGSLSTIIIRGTNSPSLSNISYFNGTPFASGGTGGTLYVPSAMISWFQSATNWSTILGYDNNSIAAIEGSIYETQYADGTPVEE